MINTCEWPGACYVPAHWISCACGSMIHIGDVNHQCVYTGKDIIKPWW